MKAAKFNISADCPAELNAENISKIYTGPAENIEVLKDISFSLQSGESMSITGPSGSGKSTLLNIIAALIRPSVGKISLEGHDYSQLDSKASSSFRGKFVGMVFQDHLLIDHLSALDNILIGAMAAGPVSKDKIQRAKTLADSLGIADRCDHLPAEMSGGQKQRTAIARALINSPKIVLADEPTGQLDESCSADVADLLFESFSNTGAMLILATHDKALAAKADNRYQLDGGCLIKTSSTEVL